MILPLIFIVIGLLINYWLIPTLIVFVAGALGFSVSFPVALCIVLLLQFVGAVLFK